MHAEGSPMDTLQFPSQIAMLDVTLSCYKALSQIAMLDVTLSCYKALSQIAMLDVTLSCYTKHCLR